LIRLIRSLALMTEIKNLGRHTRAPPAIRLPAQTQFRTPLYLAMPPLPFPSILTSQTLPVGFRPPPSAMTVEEASSSGGGEEGGSGAWTREQEKAFKNAVATTAAEAEEDGGGGRGRRRRMEEGVWGRRRGPRGEGVRQVGRAGAQEGDRLDRRRAQVDLCHLRFR
jgi:hypothetical protein